MSSGSSDGIGCLTLLILLVVAMYLAHMADDIHTIANLLLRRAS